MASAPCVAVPDCARRVPELDAVAVEPALWTARAEPGSRSPQPGRASVGHWPLLFEAAAAACSAPDCAPGRPRTACRTRTGGARTGRRGAAEDGRSLDGPEPARAAPGILGERCHGA